MMAGYYLEFIVDGGHGGQIGVITGKEDVCQGPLWPLVQLGVLRVAGGLVALQPDLKFYTESGHHAGGPRPFMAYRGHLLVVRP